MYREQLQERLGVDVSQEWLSACQDFVERDGSNQSMFDSILQHLLDSDLRDVVRSDTIRTIPSSVQDLYAALQQSAADGKASLPPSFRLLCQVEELVNVSLNAESRLARASGPTAAPARTANNATSNRCLKILLCHGHPQDATTTAPVVGMEVTAIPDLSTNLERMGCKLLLQGPLVVRWGMLQLHAGNCLVVGGHVPVLVQAHQKAVEQAQKAGGVGVDATIRALIGTSGIDEAEDDPTADEGEGASTDVIASDHATAAPPSTFAISTPQHQPRPQTTSHMPGQTGQPRAPTSAAAHPSSVSSNRQTGQFGTRRVPTNPPPTTTLAPPVQHQVTQSVSRPVSTSFTNANMTTATNPYQRRAPQTTATTNSSTDSSMVTRRPLQQAAMVVDPVLPARNSVPSRSVHTPITTTMPMELSPSNMANAATSLATTASPQVSASGRIPFSRLYRLLQQLLLDQAKYDQVWKEQHEETTPGLFWEVELHQKGGQMEFDLERKGKGLGKKIKTPGGKKQYDFLIHATFGDTSSSTVEIVSCKLPSSLIEPYFGQSPTELRALSRQDKTRSHQIVVQGGEGVKQAFFGRRVWKARLFPTTAQLFTGAVVGLDNVKIPILLLEPL